MKISVSKLDIKRGIRHDSDLCPVAIAVRRASRKRAVTAGVGFINIGSLVYRTPYAASEFIADFDNAHSVEPFEFQLFSEDLLTPAFLSEIINAEAF